ncbi:MAG TPA: RNA methyltransferase [Candidatus Kapabacteria bacterium]|nr:RNA methyltransferase [Candidatus Kapabacteria bacterium]
MRVSIQKNYSREAISHFTGLRLPQSGDHFIIETDKVVTSLLESQLEVISLFLTEEYFNKKRALIEAHSQDAEAAVFLAPKNEMEQIVGFALHQGIMAAAKIPRECSLDEIIHKSTKPVLLVILDEIADAENMGAIYRTALAMGASAILIDNRSISPWIRRAVRVSMGAVFDLPTITVDSLLNAIEQIKNSNISVYATTISANAQSLWSVDLTKDVALIFGSEGYGIKDNVISSADAEITFPMPVGIDSLNVAITEGVFLYEVARQRKINS